MVLVKKIRRKSKWWPGLVGPVDHVRVGALQKKQGQPQMGLLPSGLQGNGGASPLQPDSQGGKDFWRLPFCQGLASGRKSPMSKGQKDGRTTKALSLRTTTANCASRTPGQLLKQLHGIITQRARGHLGSPGTHPVVSAGARTPGGRGPGRARKAGERGEEGPGKDGGG